MSDLHTDVCSNASLSEHNLSKFKFRKAERLCSKKQIELLFEGCLLYTSDAADE